MILVRRSAPATTARQPAVRCSHVKPDGRRCTQRAVPTAQRSDLCADHARLDWRVS